MIAIGFANKFYTLWEISEDSQTIGNGCRVVVTHHTYIKNISFDKETALAKYPDAVFNEGLKGKTSSWDSAPKEIWDNVDTFRFGKFKYEKIDSKADNNYLEWYWNQVYDEHKEYVGSVLKSRGYEIRTWGDNNQYLMDPESLEREKFELYELNKKIEEVSTGNPINLFITCNPNDEGYYRDGNVVYHFQEVKENWYAGCPYYIPVLKGKAKRVKNKNIIIKNYFWKNEDNILNIEILDFEIEK